MYSSCSQWNESKFLQQLLEAASQLSAYSFFLAYFLLEASVKIITTKNKNNNNDNKNFLPGCPWQGNQAAENVAWKGTFRLDDNLLY